MRLLIIFLFSSFPLYSLSYVRYNEAGYTPSSKKVVIIMADSSLEGKKWTLYNSTNLKVLEGTLGASESDSGTFMPLRFNYKADITSVKKKDNIFLISTDNVKKF